VTESDYLFANQAPESADRFGALSSLFDPVTVRHLDRLGATPGWRCLEVGAGSGSIAGWLAGRVGEKGHVLATDLDVRWLAQRLRAPNVEVRQHDVVHDALPEQYFDLVHERLVLVHVRERVAALARLVSALRPGGWLLVEDFDSDLSADPFVDPASADEELGVRVVRGVRMLLARRGADTALGHKLPQMLRAAGLVDVGADAYQVIDGGDASRELQRANVTQVADELIDQGFLGRDELERYLQVLDDGAVQPLSPLLVSAWGRRPR
jgi:ubiquinone/menaquinone biosynthesis C-methylase UbiE